MDVGEAAKKLVGWINPGPLCDDAIAVKEGKARSVVSILQEYAEAYPEDETPMELFTDMLGRYGHMNCFCNVDNDQDMQFASLHGPNVILSCSDHFLEFFMIKKVHCTSYEKMKCGKAIGKLTMYCEQKGYFTEDGYGNAVETNNNVISDNNDDNNDAINGNNDVNIDNNNADPERSGSPNAQGNTTDSASSSSKRPTVVGIDAAANSDDERAAKKSKESKAHGAGASDDEDELSDFNPLCEDTRAVRAGTLRPVVSILQEYAKAYPEDETPMELFTDMLGRYGHQHCCCEVDIDQDLQFASLHSSSVISRCSIEFLDYFMTKKVHCNSSEKMECGKAIGKLLMYCQQKGYATD